MALPQALTCASTWRTTPPWETHSMKRFAGAVLTIASMMLSASAGAQGAPQGFSKEQVRSALQALLPAGVVIDELTLDGDRATAKGTASASEQVSQFMRRIDSAAEFEMPELLTIGNVNGRMEYAVSATVSCPADTVATGPGLCGSTPVKTRSVYKCRIDGTVTFQSTACPPGKDA